MVNQTITGESSSSLSSRRFPDESNYFAVFFPRIFEENIHHLGDLICCIILILFYSQRLNIQRS